MPNSQLELSPVRRLISSPEPVRPKFVFMEPPDFARNQHEFDMIVMHRQAYGLILNASLDPIWNKADELMTVNRFYADRVYILFEFTGPVFERLTELGCRVVGPLAVLQSHVYRCKFPMRTTPTWSQSLCDQVITAMGVNQDELKEVIEKTVRLGGVYKRNYDPERTTIIIVGVRDNQALIVEAMQKGIRVLYKKWIDAIYESACKLERDSTRFFAERILSSNRVDPYRNRSSARQTQLEARMDAAITESQAFSQMHDQLDRTHRVPSRRQTSTSTTGNKRGFNVSSVRSNLSHPEKSQRMLSCVGASHQPGASNNPDTTTGSRKRSATTQHEYPNHPEYVSQGPVLQPSNGSTTQNQPIIWVDSVQQLTQANYSTTQANKDLERYTVGASFGSNPDDLDLFADDEERELFNKQFGP